MPGVSIHVVDVSRGVVAAGMEDELHAIDAGGKLALIAKGRVGANGLLDAPELLKTFAPGRNVAARGEGAAAALLLLRQIPGEIELGRVGVRRVLEDCGADQEHRRGIGLREHRLDRLARLLEPRRGRGGIEGRELLAGGDGVRYRGMPAGDEDRLLRHVFVYV